MAGKKRTPRSKQGRAADRSPAPASGVDDSTRSAFKAALLAKNARDSQRSGEDHLNASGMTLHPNDKQQRTHRRKSG